MLSGASHILHKGCDTAFAKRRQWVLFSLSTLRTCIHAWTQSSCLCVKHFIRKRFIKSAESRSLPSRRLDYIHQQIINCMVLIWCNHCDEAAGMHSREEKSVYLTLATYQVLTVSVSVCAQSCLTLCDPMDCSPARLLCPWGSPGKNTGVGCHFLLHRIFPTQGSNPRLLHCRETLYHWATWNFPISGIWAGEKDSRKKRQAQVGLWRRVNI